MESENEEQFNVQVKRNFISANDLRDWYKNTAKEPIVILVEDIDFFPLQVAQNLLMAFR